MALIGLIEITILGLTNYTKLVEELDSKEDASLAIFLWYNEVINEGTMLGPTNRIIEYISLGIVRCIN